MRRASWMSLGMMVTLLAWMAQRLVSSKSPTSAATADDWKRRSVLKSCAISRTSRWKGSLRMSSSVLFWYLRISRSATVPGRKRWGFFTPPVAGADLRAALVASCFLGALPPVDFLAVCLVRAIGAGRGGWDRAAARGDWRIWGDGKLECELPRVRNGGIAKNFGRDGRREWFRLLDVLDGEDGAARLAIRVVGGGGMPLAGAASRGIAGPTL
ncbi:hypothetical protein SETIT_7G105500v2 [Setaria italica]|uniref:Secreted protein n=1 Tax=Setaria italica TaxID=4555 RepID=A0A368RUB7_SETIT|nr:hypothetical protein SETIT_7G105500v2 [Setaria italica]